MNFYHAIFLFWGFILSPKILAYTATIQIGQIQCKGTIVELENSFPGKPQLALLTAGHCLKDKILYDFVKTVTIHHGAWREIIRIKDIHFASDEFLKLGITSLPKNKNDYTANAIWCEKFHQIDIALVELETIPYLSSSKIGIYDTNSEHELQFKTYNIKADDFKNFSFKNLLSYDNSINQGIEKGNSGLPLFSNEKIVGVASCSIQKEKSNYKKNYFAAWNEVLQTAINKIN